MSFDVLSDKLRLEVQLMENDVKNNRPVTKYRWNKALSLIDSLEGEYVNILDELGRLSSKYTELRSRCDINQGLIYTKGVKNE